MNTPYHGYPFWKTKSFCIDCGTQKDNDGYLVCPSCNEIRKHAGEEEDARDQEQTINDVLLSFRPF